MKKNILIAVLVVAVIVLTALLWRKEARMPAQQVTAVDSSQNITPHNDTTLVKAEAQIYVHPKGYYSVTYPNGWTASSYPSNDGKTPDQRLDIQKMGLEKNPVNGVDIEVSQAALQIFGPSTSKPNGQCNFVDLTQRTEKKITASDLSSLSDISYCVNVKASDGTYSILANNQNRADGQMETLRAIATSMNFR